MPKVFSDDVVDKQEGKTEQAQNVGQMTIEESPKKIGIGYRHQQTVILFFCLTVAYSMRACMGVSLVAMVNGFHDITLITNTTGIGDETDTASVGLFNGILYDDPFPTFQWSKKIQDAILASFSWGYMILQIPAGQLAHRFGTRYLLTGALVINGVVSFSMPWAVYYGDWILAVICRILQGLSQSCIIPGMHTAFGKWTPLEERGRLTAFAYGGQALGTVLGMPITGFIAASPLGWPGIFRFYGILCGIVGTALWVLGADSPAEHRSISVAERRYIEEALGRSGPNKHRKVPWKRLLRCKGLWAIVIAHIGHTWGQLTLYTEVPAFMDKVMKVDIKANGLLTALPFFVMWLVNFFWSWLADMLVVKKYLSVTNTRKFAHTMGCIPPAIGLMALAYVEKDIFVVETILVLICSFKIAAHLGFHINHIDIAPNFAGTMMSISNFSSNLVGSSAPIVAGFILTDVINHIDIAPNFAGTMMSISNFSSNLVGSSAPIVAGFILTDVSSELLWRQVFLVAAGFYIVTDLVYVILGSAELEDWNDSGEEKREPVENGADKPMLNSDKT